MKKLLLLSILALRAMTMSAQLEYLGTINKHVDEILGNSDADPFNMYNSTVRPDLQYFTLIDTTTTTVTLKLLSVDDLSEVKSITLNRSILQPSQYCGYGACACWVYKNFWALDNKVYFILQESNKVDTNIRLYNEDGDLIQSFYDWNLILMRSTNGYLLLEPQGDRESGYSTKIYSVPGNGQPTDIDAPTAPARTSSARKIIENGQMYIILDGVKYAVTGSTTM